MEALKAQQLEVVRRLEAEILALKQRPDPVQETIHFKSKSDVEIEMNEGGYSEDPVDYYQMYKDKEEELAKECQ